MVQVIQTLTVLRAQAKVAQIVNLNQRNPGRECGADFDGCYVMAIKKNETVTTWARGCCITNSTMVGNHCSDIHEDADVEDVDQTW